MFPEEADSIYQSHSRVYCVRLILWLCNHKRKKLNLYNYNICFIAVFTVLFQGMKAQTVKKHFAIKSVVKPQRNEANVLKAQELDILYVG